MARASLSFHSGTSASDSKIRREPGVFHIGLLNPLHCKADLHRRNGPAVEDVCRAAAALPQADW